MSYYYKNKKIYWPITIEIKLGYGTLERQKNKNNNFIEASIMIFSHLIVLLFNNSIQNLSMIKN